MKTKALIFSFCCLLIVAFSVVSGVYGEELSSLSIQSEQLANCNALDLVILIDQSDSMYDTNDKAGNRFDAAKTIIRVLGNHAVWLCLNQNVQHRVAVVGFGDNPAQPVYSENGNELADNPFLEDTQAYVEDQLVPPVNNFDNWKKDREKIEENIESGENNRLGATDHKAALQRSQEILDGWQENPIPGVPRRQAVILITDGEPCLFARGCTKVGYYDIRPDLDSIEALTDRLGDDFPWRGEDNPNSVDISLIAMSSRTASSFSEAFFSRWQKITQDHNGDVYRANDANTNLNTIVTDILNPIIGSGLESVSCNTDVWVNPYIDNLIVLYAFSLVDDLDDVQSAVITIDTGDANIEVRGGSAGSPSVKVAQHVQDERNEYYVFPNPAPGKYRISLPGSGTCESQLDIRLDKKPVDFKVEMPIADSSFPALDPPSLIAGEKFRVLVFQVGENAVGNQPLVEIPGGKYPLHIDVSVVSDDGQFTYETRLRKVADGVYESFELIPSPIVGTYFWSLTATVKNPQPEAEPLEVFFASGEYSATEVKPFGFEISEPVDGSDLLLNSVQGAQQIPIPIPVVVTFLDDDGKGVSVLEDKNDLFEARLSSGTTVLEHIPLEWRSDTNEFVGEFSNSEAGEILRPGNYTIEVEAVWDSENYDPLKYAPAINHAAVYVNQSEIIPLDMVIHDPGDITLHQDNWRDSLYGRLRPFGFQVEIINALTGDPVTLDNVMSNVDDPIQAALIPPSGNPVIVPLQTLRNENFQQFVADEVGKDLAEEGTYDIKIQMNDIHLLDGFAWAGSEQVVSFDRVDTAHSNPGTWRLYAGIYLALTSVLLIITLFFWLGGPKGKISFLELNTYGQMETVAGPIRLRRMPRRNRRKHNWLKQHGIKYIQVRKAAP
ncbi:MAG: VWA domain-containing protein, partial [Saprospiraceae bacterium]|nr:VWA domain-containing protein [Saprospiraceae bacterium]